VIAWLILTVSPVLLLRWFDPPLSMFMIIDRWKAALADDSGYRFAYAWVDREDMSVNAQVAVIAAEDQRFANHAGFDLKEIGKALSARQRGDSTRGASTITQQTAKNLFLWPGQSWVRKGIEAWLTLLIEAIWPKARILEVYINVAQFGPGTFGIEAASIRFYRKAPDTLTDSEAALLAAVLPNPTDYRVDAPSSYVRTRQQWILRQMRAIGGAGYLATLD
jgi:monofunctional biosynthetic peptidoglycan transglycosylase